MSILNEINRIRRLMLFENFKGSEKIIINYIERLIENIGGEKLFDSFFEGEKTLRDFKERLKTKILRGDYGNNIGDVQNNLKYLKRIGAILGTVKREYEKNPDDFSFLNYGGTIPEDKILSNINEKVLYGEFCRDCKNPKDVRGFIEYEIEKMKAIDEETKQFDNPENFRKAAFNFFGTNNYPALKPFLYKGFFDNLRTLFGILDKRGFERDLKQIKDKYGIYSMQWAHSEPDDDVLDMNKLPTFLITFQENYEIKVSETNIKYQFDKEKQYPFNYLEGKLMLIHRTPEKKGNQFDIYLRVPSRLPNPQEFDGKIFDGKFVTVKPLGGSVIEVDTKLDVKFSITKK
jgi:hypothetical protein